MLTKEKYAHSLLLKATKIRPDFWSAYYLDAYEIKKDFLQSSSNPIYIKTNAVTLLKKRLANHRPQRDIVTLGTMADPYGTAEKQYRLTRGLLETLASYVYPVHIMTASDAIYEDLELLETLSHNYLHISIPVPYLHPLYERFYPDDHNDALALMKSLRKKLPKVHLSAVVSPLIPTVGDEKEALHTMAKKLKLSGANSAHFSWIENLTAKKTQTLIDLIHDRKDALDILRQTFTLEMEDGVLHSGFIELSEEDRTSFDAKIGRILEAEKLDKYVPRYLPKDYRYSNYLLSERLYKRAAEYAQNGKDANRVIDLANLLQSLDHTIQLSELKRWLKEPEVRRDIEYFLFSKELRTYGQASLF